MKWVLYQDGRGVTGRGDHPLLFPARRLARWLGGKLQDWGVALNYWSWR